MNEFWAIVLGAALATLGGIIGTLFSNSIEKRKERKNKKTEAYIKILSFLHKIKFAKCSEKEFTFQQIAEVTALGKVYGSEQVQKNYDMVTTVISEMYNLEYKSNEYNKKWMKSILS